MNIFKTIFLGSFFLQVRCSKYLDIFVDWLLMPFNRFMANIPRIKRNIRSKGYEVDDYIEMVRRKKNKVAKRFSEIDTMGSTCFHILILYILLFSDAILILKRIFGPYVENILNRENAKIVFYSILGISYLLTLLLQSIWGDDEYLRKCKKISLREQNRMIKKYVLCFALSVIVFVMFLFG